jgi:hypothetical protein
MFGCVFIYFLFWGYFSCVVWLFCLLHFFAKRNDDVCLMRFFVGNFSFSCFTMLVSVVCVFDCVSFVIASVLFVILLLCFLFEFWFIFWLLRVMVCLFYWCSLLCVLDLIVVCASVFLFDWVFVFVYVCLRNISRWMFWFVFWVCIYCDCAWLFSMSRRFSKPWMSFVVKMRLNYAWVIWFSAHAYELWQSTRTCVFLVSILCYWLGVLSVIVLIGLY